MSNGAWVINDSRSRTVRVFPRGGTDGRLLARGGNGPGELPGAFEMQIVNDTVYTFGIPPMSPSEIRLYDHNSGFVRTIPARVEGQPRMTVIGRLDAASYLVKRGIGGIALDRPPKAGIAFPDSATFGVLTMTGSTGAPSVTWMPAVQSSWYFSYPFKGSPVVPTSVDRYPFSDATIVLGSADRIFEIATASGAVRVLDKSGSMIASGTSSLKRVAFDSRQLARARQSELAQARRDNDSSRINAKYARAILPDRAPLFAKAIAADAGEVWLEVFDLAPNAVRRYVILNRDGRETARATLPSGFEPHQITRDFIVGVLHDDGGEIAVVEYSLRRPK
ncbi:MAG: hypothetical protein ACO1Q7_07465 [Gemmatimonas sp.]